MFNSKTLTADPSEHLRRAKILLDLENDSLLLYAALEMRLAIERIIHNQLTLSELHSKKEKKKNDPKRKKLIMGKLDPNSDYDCDIFYIDENTQKNIYWGTYKNIPTQKVKKIEGKLGNLLHMKLGVKLRNEEDQWYTETRDFLTKNCRYLTERITDSIYYFNFQNMENYEFVIK